MAKTANLYARIEPQLKEQAEGILASLGVSSSSAINMFYKQIVLRKGLPFEVTLPERKPLDLSEMTMTELNQALDAGYADMKAGRVRSAKSVFSDIRKDYEL